jgi:carbonic anhydrase
VLGHTSCGAIKGAIDDVKLGNLTQLLQKFKPAIDAARNVPGPRTSKNHELVDAVCEENAKLTAASLTVGSPVLRELVASNELRIVAALHDLETGQIKFLS